ncbi:MAG: septum formation initiator family protein [Papillibacter sp.]|nr:septum formation initiator family protein [Papillibacter sp.]
MVSLVRVQGQIDEATAAKAVLEEKYQKLSVINETLKYEIENSTDPETIEEVARDKLGLVLPGEIIFYDMSN